MTHWQPWGFVTIAVLLGLLVATLPLTYAGLVIATTAVFLLTFVQPLVGLGLALLLGPLGAWENVLFGATILDSGQLSLLLTIAVWGARGLRNGRLLLPHTALNWPLALFLFIAGLTLLDAPSLTFGLKELIKWLEIGLLMLIVVDLAPTKPNQANWYAWLIVGLLLLSGIAQAFIGIWQFGLRGDGPEHFLILGRFYRAFGTFMQPNPFGGFMNLTSLLALGIALGTATWLWQHRRSGTKPEPVEGGLSHNKHLRQHTGWLWLAFGLSATSAAIIVVGLLMSWSRGAWLGFAAGAFTIVFFWPRQRWQGGVLLLVGTAVLLIGFSLNLIPASITTRLTSFQDDFRLGDVRGVDVNDTNYAVLERLAHWQAALDMARDELWLGVGFGNYEPAYEAYALINWPDPLGHAHNYYFNLLAEVGIVGLLAYILLWTAVFWQTIRLLQLDWPQRGIVLGLLAAWVALTVHHVVDKLYVNNIYIHIGVMFGLLQHLALREKV
ncbi:MAG: O-antigen ligase family protein [Chloroflexota bacterium]